MSEIVPFQTIQLSQRTQFSSIWPINRTLSAITTPEPRRIWKRWQWRGTLHFQKLQNFTIGLFRVKFGHWEGLIPLQRSSRCILQTQPTGQFTVDTYFLMLSVKQGGIKYHFLSLWYNSAWRTIYPLDKSWPENPASDVLGLISSVHPDHFLEIEPATTEYRAETLPLSNWLAHMRSQINKSL